MTAVTPTVERPSPKMILVVVLLVAVFVSAVIDIVIPINIMDIAATFGVQTGSIAQLDSIIAISSVASALLLGAVGGKFRYKLLVMVGLLFIAFCAIGLFFVPTFSLARLVVPLNGIGSVLIIVTTQTFIGNSYPLDKKAKAISWVSAAGTLAIAVGSPTVGFMTGMGGWRSSLIWFMLPAAVISLVLVFLVFPFNLPEPQQDPKKEPFMRGFKQVLANKSAVACLVSVFLGNAFWFGGALFEVTFLRQVFSVSPGFASLIGPLVGAALVTVGAVIGGYIINRVGRKRLTVITTFSAGLFLLLSYSMPALSSFLVLHYAASILVGITVAAASNLMLEQVPRFRGTSMSLSSAFGGVGTAIGFAVAGAVLNLYVNPTIGFQMLGLTIGSFAFAGALLILFLAKDPVRELALDKETGISTLIS